MDELELLTAVVAHPAEFEITLPGGLTMCRLDEDHYTVEYDHPTEDGEREWRERRYSLTCCRALILSNDVVQGVTLLKTPRILIDS